jgi:GTP-binding protein
MVELVRDAAHPREFPVDALPEVAVLGRSNAGKSSLLNALVGRRRLARTSSSPGKTRRIHFYRVERGLYLVDLPGYGYAAVPQAERQTWRAMAEGYLGADRPVLRGALLLMDVRRKVSDEERDLVAWLQSRQVAVRIVLSKADKLSPPNRANALGSAVRDLSLTPDCVAAVSARTGIGMAAVAGWIQGWSAIELRRADGQKF